MYLTFYLEGLVDHRWLHSKQMDHLSSHVPNGVIPCTSQPMEDDPTRRQGSRVPVCGGSYDHHHCSWPAFHMGKTGQARTRGEGTKEEELNSCLVLRLTLHNSQGSGIVSRLPYRILLQSNQRAPRQQCIEQSTNLPSNPHLPQHSHQSIGPLEPIKYAPHPPLPHLPPAPSLRSRPWPLRQILRRPLRRWPIISPTHRRLQPYLHSRVLRSLVR